MPVPSEPMTPEKKELARFLYHDGDMSEHDIAALMCCNHGRVSTALTENNGNGPRADISKLRTQLLLGTCLARCIMRLSGQVARYLEPSGLFGAKD